MINFNKVFKQIDSRLPPDDESGIKLAAIRWAVTTAGPSPLNNERTEIFFLGCEKAMRGYPCEGCFNKSTWSFKADWTHDPVLMAKHINNNAPNKYITIGGGEPLDNIENLIVLCEELKKYGFHIIVYTWRRLKTILIKNPVITDNFDIVRDLEVGYFPIELITKLLNSVDIIIDGQYKKDLRLWNGNKKDGFLSSIGSGNQIVWNINNKIGYRMMDLDGLELDKNNNLIYLPKNDAKKIIL